MKYNTSFAHAAARITGASPALLLLQQNSIIIRKQENRLVAFQHSEIMPDEYIFYPGNILEATHVSKN